MRLLAAHAIQTNAWCTLIGDSRFKPFHLKHTLCQMRWAELNVTPPPPYSPHLTPSHIQPIQRVEICHVTHGDCIVVCCLLLVFCIWHLYVLLEILPQGAPENGVNTIQQRNNTTKINGITISCKKMVQLMTRVIPDSNGITHSEQRSLASLLLRQNISFTYGEIPFCHSGEIFV